MVSRRQRLRDATVEEIKTVARDLICREGSSFLQVRAVARAMGIAPSALYRYFPSREAILTALITDAFDAVGDAVEEAMAAAPHDRTATAILAGAHAFRRWALDHPQEYGLIYGTPVPGYSAPAEETTVPALRTSIALLGEMVRALELGLMAPPAPGPVPPDVLASLTAFAGNDVASAIDLHPTMWALAMQFWIVLYGSINAEVFGHLPEPLRAGSGAFFDYTLRRALAVMGVRAEALDAAVSPAF